MSGNEPFLPVIREWMADGQRGPNKLRHTAHRVFTRLVSEYGFTGSERTLQNHVSRMKQEFEDISLPLSTPTPMPRVIGERP